MQNPIIPIAQIDGDNLFGRENADLEDSELFESYSLDKQSFINIYDPKRKIGLLCAYKGCGKSAVLRLINNRLKSNDSAVIVKFAAPEYAPDSNSNDPVDWLRNWRKIILRQIASEIGASIKFAYNDDATHLVETSQKYGFREANIVGYITKRAADSYQLTKTADSLEEGVSKRMERYLSKKDMQVWLLIDDVDLNFKNDPKNKSKIVGFLNAIKSLTLQIPDLRVRSTIRPNIWSILALEYDSVNQLKEFIINLDWSDQDIRDLLRKRVSSYYERARVKYTPPTIDPDRAWIKCIFEDPMNWGKSTRPPYIVLDTLSKNRPRWLIELCKLALDTAKKADHQLVSLSDIELNLPGFGAARIVDTVAEYSGECPQISQLLNCFRSQEKTWTQNNLETFIRNSILPRIKIKIHGVIGTPTSVDIIKFLFYTGFLSYRFDANNGRYEHKMYSDSPTLLSTNFPVKNVHTWEIHPVYVVALGMTNYSPMHK